MAAGGSGTILLPQAGGSSQGARRPSRAFLIQQRDSGEETLVTLTPVVGGRLVNHNHPTTSQVPTIVGPPTAQNLKSKGSMSSIGKSPTIFVFINQLAKINECKSKWKNFFCKKAL